MPRGKRKEEETEVIQEVIEETPEIMRVMTKDTKTIIKIDAKKEKDWKTKYLHVSGKTFE